MHEMTTTRIDDNPEIHRPLKNSSVNSTVHRAERRRRQGSARTVQGFLARRRFLDVKMPRLGGLDVLHEIRAQNLSVLPDEVYREVSDGSSSWGAPPGHSV